MVAQHPALSRIAAISGALNLTADTLAGTDIIGVATPGQASAQTTLDALAEFLGITPFVVTARVVTSNALAGVESTDVALLINKVSPGATPISLPAGVLGRILIFKDMKGDAEANPITLDAGSGKLINGQQTLVMSANFATTILIGMSATQWGTLI